MQVSGKNIMPDEIIDELNLSWEGKHDRWAGYGPVSPKPAPSTGCRPADPSLPAAATLPVARSTHAHTKLPVGLDVVSLSRSLLHRRLPNIGIMLTHASGTIRRSTPK